MRSSEPVRPSTANAKIAASRGAPSGYPQAEGSDDSFETWPLDNYRAAHSQRDLPNIRPFRRMIKLTRLFKCNVIAFYSPSKGKTLLTEGVC